MHTVAWVVAGVLAVVALATGSFVALSVGVLVGAVAEAFTG